MDVPNTPASCGPCGGLRRSSSPIKCVSVHCPHEFRAVGALPNAIEMIAHHDDGGAVFRAYQVSRFSALCRTNSTLRVLSNFYRQRCVDNTNS